MCPAPLWPMFCFFYPNGLGLCLCCYHLSSMRQSSIHSFIYFICMCQYVLMCGNCLYIFGILNHYLKINQIFGGLMIWVLLLQNKYFTRGLVADGEIFLCKIILDNGKLGGPLFPPGNF